MNGYSMQGNGKYGIGFKNFKKYMESQYEMTTAEIYQIYRDLKMLGEGVVSADLFITYSNENCLFTNYLKLPQWIDVPKFEEGELAVSV